MAIFVNVYVIWIRSLLSPWSPYSSSSSSSSSSHHHHYLHPPPRPPPHYQHRHHDMIQFANPLNSPKMKLLITAEPKDEMIVLLTFSLQFRYGNVWGPPHPTSSVGTTLYSFALEENESFETLEFNDGWIIDSIRFNTTKRSSGQLGKSDILTGKVSLKGVVYFTGREKDFSTCNGPMVSRLSPRLSLCHP